MTEKAPASLRTPLWILVALVAATAAYFVWADYERHREPTPEERQQQAWDEFDERMTNLRARQEVDRIINR